MKDSKILDKLNKLLAMSAGAKAIGSEAEAAAFAEKIQELLDRHNLSMTDVELHAAESAPIGIEPVNTTLERLQIWQNMLLDCIAKINGCFAVENSLGFLAVVGRETDRKIVLNFYRFFDAQGKILAKDFEESYKTTIEYQVGKMFGSPRVPRYHQQSFFVSFEDPIEKKLESYMIGFASAVCERLEKVYRQDHQDRKNAQALVSLDRRSEQAADWLKSQVPVSDKGPEIRDIDSESYHAGVAAGERSAITDKILG